MGTKIVETFRNAVSIHVLSVCHIGHVPYHFILIGFSQCRLLSVKILSHCSDMPLHDPEKMFKVIEKFELYGGFIVA